MKRADTMPDDLYAQAVFVFGEYPQREWGDAERTLAAKVRYIAGKTEISPTAVWLLGRRLFGKRYQLNERFGNSTENGNDERTKERELRAAEPRGNAADE